MRRFTALWESFFSKSFYYDVFYQWRGIGFTLLLLLVVIQTLLSAVQIHLGVRTFAREYAPPILKQIPTVTFHEGKATTPEPIRYDITDPTTGELFAIIDTRIPAPPKDLGGARIFMAGESTTMKKNNFEQRSYDYTSFGTATVDRKMIESWIGVLETFAALVCAPFVFVFLLIWRVIQLLFFSLIALVVCSIRQVSGSYAAKLRLTAAALTPGLVLTILGIAFSVDFPGINLLFCALVVAYLVFGAGAARQEITIPEIPKYSA